MTPITARLNTETARSSSSTPAVAKIHSDLLDRLAKTLVHLGRAKSHLRSAIAAGDAAQYESAFFEVEKLRTDCSNIRVELEWRRAQQDLAQEF